MPDPYPGYDVLSKRNTPSWNDKTREVIDRRLSLPRSPRFFSEPEFATVEAIAAHIVPQPKHRPPVPVAALVDDKLFEDVSDGYRMTGLPREREAWRRGLLALNAEAEAAHQQSFRHLAGPQQHDLLKRMEQGDLKSDAWGGMPSKLFWKERLLTDIVHAYFSHPTAWSEIGWGGPASPRGYVRLGYDERDSWEAVEAHGDPDYARRKNRHVG